MSLHALTNLIISRSLSEIRIALFNSANMAKGMLEFAKAAEKVVPLSYSREGIINTITTQIDRNEVYKKHATGRKEKYCEIHDKSWHSTDECNILTKLKKTW